MRRAPEPTSADVAAWRRLVREARRAAADPEASCGDLRDAFRKAKQAVVLGLLARGNPCVDLVDAARQYVEETTRGRREAAPRLLQFAAGVEAKISGPSSPASAPISEPARRLRADIDDVD